jgi:leucyl aminopeptidase (aminopeptidase T)
LKELCDRANTAILSFRTPSGQHRLTLDLRHRTGHASGGLFPANGVAGNLPSGEAYIVPYEGERSGDPSESAGELPVQIGAEIVVYQISENRVSRILSSGAASDKERDHLAREPAYANLAELGLGVLGDFGLKPVGSILLDEKLGLHIAFGRSDHFGGTVGPSAFSSPDAVIHLDRVYIPECQPQVEVETVRLILPTGEKLLMQGEQFKDLF